MMVKKEEFVKVFEDICDVDVEDYNNFKVWLEMDM